MRGLLSTLLTPRAATNAGPTWAPDDDRWYSSGGNKSNAGLPVTPEIAMRVSAVYACVALLAKSVAVLPLRMYQTVDGKKTEAPNHPLNDLLEYRPNSWQTPFEFKSMLMMHLALRGNALAEIIPGRRGFADSLEPIHPDRVSRIERLDDRSLRYSILEPNGATRRVLQDEMFHIRGPICPSGTWALSPIAYARETVGLALAGEEHGARSFSNGARPSGVVEIDKRMSDPAFERFKKEWSDLYMGVSNSGKTAILEEGAKFKAISMTNEDAQFIASRKFQIEEIARWFDVPLVMLHDTEKSTSWGTGVESIMLAFVRNTLMPWLSAWTDAVRRDLILAPRTYGAEFDVEAMQRGDSKATAEYFSRLVTNGILTRNEARAALGYNEIDGLEKPLVPVNLTTTDNMPDHAVEIAPEEPAPAPGKALSGPESAAEPINVTLNVAVDATKAAETPVRTARTFRIVRGDGSVVSGEVADAPAAG